MNIKNIFSIIITIIIAIFIVLIINKLLSRKFNILKVSEGFIQDKRKREACTYVKN